jgi:3-oxoacyl-[acyl-carrier protein] reductase
MCSLRAPVGGGSQRHARNPGRGRLDRTHRWSPYDGEAGSEGGDREPLGLVDELRGCGVRAELVEADLGDPAAPGQLFQELQRRLGPFTALVASHCRDIELSLLATSAPEFDRHFAVNARSVALLIQEFANRLPDGDGRVVAFTSDALSDNVPYGVSKAALDRISRLLRWSWASRDPRELHQSGPHPRQAGSDQLQRACAHTLGRPTHPRRADLALPAVPEGGWITS